MIPCHPAFVASVDLPTETRDVEGLARVCAGCVCELGLGFRPPVLYRSPDAP